MGLDKLIRNITAVAAMAVPMYGCEGDTTNVYEGNGGSGSASVVNACEKTCTDYACAGDFFDDGSDLKSPTFSSQECYDVCVKAWADCSDSAMNKVLSCYNQYSCDGEISWVPCLEESDELSACQD